MGNLDEPGDHQPSDHPDPASNGSASNGFASNGFASNGFAGGDRVGTLHDLDPVDIARLVRELPDQQLDELMATRVRRAVLDEIFGRMRRQIRPGKVRSSEATIHWRIGGRPGGGDDTYETVISNGTCTVSSRLEHRPRLTVAMSALTFLKLATGHASVPKLFVTRKVKVDGDIGLAVNLASLFDIPKR